MVLQNVKMSPASPKTSPHASGFAAVAPATAARLSPANPRAAASAPVIVKQPPKVRHAAVAPAPIAEGSAGDMVPQRSSSAADVRQQVTQQPGYGQYAAYTMQQQQALYYAQMAQYQQQMMFNQMGYGMYQQPQPQFMVYGYPQGAVASPQQQVAPQQPATKP